MDQQRLNNEKSAVNAFKEVDIIYLQERRQTRDKKVYSHHIESRSQTAYIKLNRQREHFHARNRLWTTQQLTLCFKQQYVAQHQITYLLTSLSSSQTAGNIYNYRGKLL